MNMLPATPILLNVLKNKENKENKGENKDE